MRIEAIAIGKNPREDVNVIIEIPMGGNPVKYELDKVSGAMFVDRFLHTAMYYPFNYGFIPHTLSEDGDPVDADVDCVFATKARGEPPEDEDDERKNDEEEDEDE